MVTLYAQHKFPPLMVQGSIKRNRSYILSNILGAWTNRSRCRGSEADQWCSAFFTIRLSNSTLRYVFACIGHLDTCGKQTRLHGVAQRTQGCLAGVLEVGTGKFSCQLASIFDSGPDRYAGDGEYIVFVRPSPAEKASPGWFSELRNSIFHICIARSAALAMSSIRRDS